MADTGSNYIPFGRPDFTDEEVGAVTDVLRSGWIGMGQETIAFERELAEFIGVPHVVTVNSCTSGLFLSLLVHGVGPGDEVICPSLTWSSTATVAMHLGAQPRFCDIDLDTLCVTPEAVCRQLSSHTKAVMVVHFGGLAVDVAELRKHLPDNVAIIEDAAHALGAAYGNGRKVGSSGNLTCFSFYANKNLSTGEGGAVALCDDGMADRLRSLRQHGMRIDAWKRYTNPQGLLVSEPAELGFKMNYTDLQACIGRIQLRRQRELAARRLKIAQVYFEALKQLNVPVRCQPGIVDSCHARHLFTVQLPLERMNMTRNQLVLQLRDLNIGASIHYAPLHVMTIFDGQESVKLPNVEHVCERILTLPISASITEDEADYVSDEFKRLVSDGR